MKLTIQHRVLILGLVPILFLAMVLTLFGLRQSSALGQQAVTSFSEDLKISKENELLNYITLAQTAIQPILEHPNSKTNSALKIEAYNILRNLRFNDSGSDGYFFVFDLHGGNEMHGVNPALEGQNLLSVQDPNGVYLVRELIHAAKQGGGYVEYSWTNSDTGAPAPKLAYAILIEEWNVLLGAGFSIDGLNQQIGLIESDIGASIHSTMVKTIAIAGCTLAIAIIAALIVARSIVRPLRSGVEAMNDIAAGGGDLTKRLKTESGCEIAAFSTSFNLFADQVQTLVKQVIGSAHSIDSASNDLSNIVQEVNQGSKSQLSESDQVANAMTEMTSAAQNIAIDASSAATATQQAERQVKEAISLLSKATGVINGLGIRVSSGVEAIRTLETHSENIGGVLDVIRSVSEQTNLLALNAAIEAARAGEAGRGFAVVADEVRTLAARSQESTNQIQDMVENVQSSAQQAVTLIEEIYQLSDEVTNEVNNVDGSLKSIQLATHTINEVTFKIASASEEQTMVSESINQNVHEIVTISNKNSHGTARAESVTAQLKAITQELSNEVERYKV